MKSAVFRGARALAGLVALLAAPAWAADTPPDMKLIEKGDRISHTVAGIGCIGCHGRYGEGDIGVGPYIRGVGLSKVQAAVAAVSPMQIVKAQLSPEDIEAVARYWSWMGQHQVVKALIKRDRFIPDVVEVYPGTSLQVVINNSGQGARKLSGPDGSSAEFTVASREFHDFIWRAPEQEGSYAFRCVDCSLPDQSLIVKVSRSARRYRVPDAEK